MAPPTATSTDRGSAFLGEGGPSPGGAGATTSYATGLAPDGRPQGVDPLPFALYAFFVVLVVGSLVLGRSSALVGDDQFLKSMIPHHSRAILVCQESDITDPEIQALCGEIIETQREESTQMEQILRRR